MLGIKFYGIDLTKMFKWVKEITMLNMKDFERLSTHMYEAK